MVSKSASAGGVDIYSSSRALDRNRILPRRLDEQLTNRVTSRQTYHIAKPLLPTNSPPCSNHPLCAQSEQQTYRWSVTRPPTAWLLDKTGHKVPAANWLFPYQTRPMWTLPAN